MLHPNRIILSPKGILKIVKQDFNRRDSHEKDCI